MMSKKSLCKIIVLALFMMPSCDKDSNYAESHLIRAKVSTTHTKAGISHCKDVELGHLSIDDVAGNNLMVSVLESDWDVSDWAVTKGSINTTEDKTVFNEARISAFLSESIQDEPLTYFSDASLNRLGTEDWVLEDPATHSRYYWPEEVGLKFWAISPVNPCGSDSINYLNDNNQLEMVYHVLPEDGIDDAVAQEDVIISYRGQKYDAALTGSSTVDFLFNHVLAAVRIDVSDLPDNISIIDVCLKDIKNQGICTAENNTGDMFFSWSVSDSGSEYHQSLESSDFSDKEISGRDKVLSLSSGKVFCLIPQELKNTAIMGLTFVTDDSSQPIYREAFIGTYDDKPVEWKSGKIYTYRISSEFDFEPLETANCYVVSDAGMIKFAAYCMGNRQSCRLYEGTPDLSASVLWSDCGMSAVTEVQYHCSNDGKGYITAKVNKDPSTGEPYRGNCVIALKDEDGTILWSWHLWLTETPEDVYTTGQCASGTYVTDGYEFQADATKGWMAIMDRNLGAISADPDDGWKTYGLLYQMGRKDPFIGAGAVPVVDRTNLSAIYDSGGYVKVELQEEAAFGSLTKGTETTDPIGWAIQFSQMTISESIAHPMTMSTLHTRNDTRWTNCEDKDNQSYMDGDAHGATGLKDEGHEAYWNRTKTIFDPCPAGYTVLGERNGVFFDADKLTAREGGWMVNSTKKDGSAVSSSWWPLPGVRTTEGILADVNYYGAYMFFDHIDAEHGWHGMQIYNKTNKDGSLTATYLQKYSNISNHAASVRCVRAKQN